LKDQVYRNGYIAVVYLLFLQEQIKDHHHLRDSRQVFVLEALEAFLVVFSEAISPGNVVTLAQQFGEGTEAPDFLEAIDAFKPSMLLHGNAMEQADVNKSAAALHKEVMHLIKHTCVWVGRRRKVQGLDGSHEGPQADKIFGQRLMEGRWTPH
jgi:hypothetical protein